MFKASKVTTNKHQNKVFHITSEQLPYNSIMHWPPMTYRNNSEPTKKAMAAFTEYLEKENELKGPKELQPWIPFCDGKCSFCYFPVNCEKQVYDSYIQSLKKALTVYSETKYIKTSEFTELYIGGGSPSVLTEEQITDIIGFCNTHFNLSKKAITKFTGCTNNLSSKKVHALARENVAQLDIGVQSFNEHFRKTLMLRDSSENALMKLKEIKKNGLGLSIDLLYNIPGQTLEQWENDLKQALELEVESVDCYPLDLYADTPLARKIASGQLPMAGDYKKELAMYQIAYELFKKNGYFPTCHNRFSRVKIDLEPPAAEVVGTGAGFFMGHIGTFNYSDVEDVQEYIQTVENQQFPISRLSELTIEDEMRKEMMMIYVRIPVKREQFKAKYGKFPEEAFPKAIEELRNKGLIVEENDEVRLSEKGDPWRFNIAWEFFK
jgi:oxygen-independent coproporphyrinogen-3 oxidase